MYLFIVGIVVFALQIGLGYKWRMRQQSHLTDLKRLTVKKQIALSFAVSLSFIPVFVVLWIVCPTEYKLGAILFICQLVVDAVYLIVMDYFCEKAVKYNYKSKKHK